MPAERTHNHETQLTFPPSQIEKVTWRNLIVNIDRPVDPRSIHPCPRLYGHDNYTILQV